MPAVATALPADVVNIDATVPPDTLPGEQFDGKVGMEIAYSMLIPSREQSAERRVQSAERRAQS
jgi:hypothetical protein